MGRILKDAEIAFLRKSREACDAALVSAAPKIEKDFKAKVFGQAVTDYYTDYKPSRYKRRKSLGRAFKAHAEIVGDSISVVGDWNFNRLPQAKSKSKYHKSGDEWISRYDVDDEGEEIFDWDSDDNGVPEKGWIFQNFMEGIHPRFITRGDIVYDESRYFEPSWKRIKKYLNEYKDSDDLKDILAKELKKQCKKMM
jgi:hypothetical protein